MRGHFSIEWMAQSSQPAGSEVTTASELTACGTTSESLPGFYCRPKSHRVLEQKEDGSGRRVDTYKPSSLQHQASLNTQVTEGSFSSGTEEETSGYESEGDRSLSPLVHHDSVSSSPASPPSGRRPRTAFTAEQIGSLERAFKRNAYLGTQDKADLCKKLNLSDKQVTIRFMTSYSSQSLKHFIKQFISSYIQLNVLSCLFQIRNWFQNRRMKLKRTMQDALAHACQANMASPFMHYPELQAYRPGPYHRYHTAAATTGAEESSAAAYVHQHSLQYGPRLPSVPTLPLDTYQYSSLILPSAPTQLMGSYPTYQQYY
uniref:Ventrally expressed dharma/bozozok antagonist n=1 Tax=Cynoglossus semilaevis TaxID=244447 RepID=A0A3P8VGT7_CYNSE